MGLHGSLLIVKCPVLGQFTIQIKRLCYHLRAHQISVDLVNRERNSHVYDDRIAIAADSVPNTTDGNTDHSEGHDTMAHSNPFRADTDMAHLNGAPRGIARAIDLNLFAKTQRLIIWAFIAMIGALMFSAHLFNSAQSQQSDEAVNTSTRPDGVVLTLNGAVTPTSADYLSREIAAASAADKDLIVIEIDTPGGLVDSMKTIIKSILASDTPVATFVSPQGARSASAGLYIMYSAHISAMAPATNTGSATPVTLGGSPGEAEPARDDKAPASDDTTHGDTTGGDTNDNDNRQTTDNGDTGREQATDSVQDAIKTIRPSPTPTRSPLSNDDALRAKIINDSVAYIRSLAELRGRNADWAESAVRDAVSVPASEALELNVIDLIADDLDDLLEKIDGKTVSVKGQERTIRTDGIVLTRIEPTVIEKILGFFANPNVAAILMSLGTTGLIIEMWNPGSVFPGAVGVISLLLGLYSFQVLPFNWLGIGLIAVGVLFMALEAYTPTFGVMGLIGLLCFGAGLYIVFPDEFRVSNTVIGTTVAIAGAFLALILFAIAGTRGHGPMIGGEAIRRREGKVVEWDGLEGHVLVEGERWRARSNQPLRPGDIIKVTDVDGLVLVVRKLKSESGGLLGGAKPAGA